MSESKKQSDALVSAETESHLDKLSKHPMFKAFEGMPENEQTKAMVMFLLSQNASQTPEQEHALREKANYLDGLEACLIKFAEKVSTEDQKKNSGIDETKKMVADLFTADKQRDRGRAYAMSNPEAAVIDDINRNLDEGLARLATLEPIAEEYLSTAKPEHDKANVKSRPINDVTVRQTGDRVESFNEMADSFRSDAEKFPELVRKVIGQAMTEKTRIAHTYGNESDNQNLIPAQVRLMLDLFDTSVSLSKRDVPVIRENLYLTAFLDAIYQEIPAIKHDQNTPKKKRVKKNDQKEPSLNYDTAQAKNLKALLQRLADPKILGYVTEGGFFKKVSDVLRRMYRHHRTVLKAYEDSEIEKQTENNPDYIRQRFRIRLEKLAEAAKGEDEDSLKTFNIGSALELLSSIELTKLEKPVQPVSSAGKPTLKERDIKILKIFEEILSDLEQLTQGKCDEQGQNWDIDSWIEELIRMKDEVTDKKTKRRKNNRIKIDQGRGNFRYEAVSAGIGNLDFIQIPTTADTLTDLVGQGWKKIATRFEDVLDYAQFEFVNSKLGPRRRMTAHSIGMGPNGCGKNHFSRVVTSDPRVIGIETSIGRLLTAWAGEAEANISRLFRGAQERVDQHEKPAFFVAGEFDSFFDANTEGASTVDTMLQRMQKELQEMLDGNLDFDNVFMMGWTNRPDRIPGDIYRRMGPERVFVVDALSKAERIELMKKLLEHIPLTHNFIDEVNWDDFGQITEDISGDNIGKIADYSYEIFRKRFRQLRPTRLANIEEEARDAANQGVILTPKQKVAMFKKGSSDDVLFKPISFNFAAKRVIEDPATQGLMVKQRQFYEDVYNMLEAAFKGEKWPNTGFDKPSDALGDAS